MMRLNPAVFWRMSWKEFTLAQRGFFESEEQKLKNMWEIARWQAYISVMPYAKEGRLSGPQSLIRFPWEKAKGSDIELLTSEEEDLLVRKMGKFMKDGKFVN